MNYMYTNGLKTFDLSSGENGPPYDQNDWGMMFVGHFQYNMDFFPGSYSNNTAVRSEWQVSGYTYDRNLTNQFIDSIGDYSPINPVKVNWSVYKINKSAENSFVRQIKVFAQPRIKTTRQWVLYAETIVDSEGQLQFYSYDAILKEKIG